MVIKEYNENPYDSLSSDLKAIAEPNRYPLFIHNIMDKYYEARVKKSWQGRHILHGKTPTSTSLIFSSNDYLNISQHPLLITAQTVAMQELGNGQMQSGVFLSNNNLLFDVCEKQFSQFLRFSSCLLTQSGWCANIGLIQALSAPEVPVYLDFYTHMSFWAGVKASGAKAIPFKHNSIDSLHKKLERYGSGIIAVDSIYSTIGTISPLKEYARLAKAYDCLLIVDESHSLGTHGPQGRGLVAELNLSDQVDIITASLAKAFSGRGGIIAGNKDLIELIRYTSLPSIFSSTLLPHDLAGFTATIQIFSEEEWRKEKLHINAHYLRESLINQGFNLCGSQSQIIPIMGGSEANTIWLRNQLEQQDIFGSVFCSPATPQNKTLIRLSINTKHKKNDLDLVIECLSKLIKQNPDYLIPSLSKQLHSQEV
jgi:CAI-1 autoinducer synthase